MNPLKYHVLKDGRAACGKTVQSKYLHPNWSFELTVEKCKKCALIFKLDMEKR